MRVPETFQRGCLKRLCHRDAPEASEGSGPLLCNSMFCYNVAYSVVITLRNAAEEQEREIEQLAILL
jgi:hypothetical protein